MQDINAWLAGDQDFNLGSVLYLKYGQSNLFKELLSSGPTPYNVKKLREELESLTLSTPATALEQIEFTSAKPSATQKATDHSKYISLCARRDEITRQLDRNMAALHFASASGVLFETAKQILRLHQQKQEIWSQIDYYQEHQTFGPVKTVPEKTREEKMQLIYQSLSKARKRLSDPNYTDRKRTEKLIEKKLNELKKLKGGDE